MRKTEFRDQLNNLLTDGIEDQTFDETLTYTYQLLIKYQKENEDKRDVTNRGKPWTDEELTIVLSAAPTIENSMRFAKLFKRKYGSIEHIYRWASTDDKDVSAKRENDTFVKQVKRIAKKLVWRT